MNIFLDTSALAKRYIQEPGSEELQDLFLSAVTEVVVSTLAMPEFAAALNRKVRDTEILKEAAANALREFEKDWEDLFFKIPLTEQLASFAASLTTTYPLRGADAIHLATAMAADVALFVASDKELIRAAEKAGMKAYDPSVGPFRNRDD